MVVLLLEESWSAIECTVKEELLSVAFCYPLCSKQTKQRHRWSFYDRLEDSKFGAGMGAEVQRRAALVVAERLFCSIDAVMAEELHPRVGKHI